MSVGDFVDFRIVKEQVSMEMVLGHYGIHLHRSNQTALRGKCPLPTHTSKESSDSFGVQTAKNIWACQSQSCASARGGKRGGNVIDFVSIMESCSIREAAEKLHAWFLSSTPASPASRSTPAAVGEGSVETGKLVSEKNIGTGEVGEFNKPLSFALKDVDYDHQYVRGRGVDSETAKLFGVGFFPGRGLMNGKVVVPIHNEKGELVAYAGRAIDGSEPKYKLPSGFHKSSILFNLHRSIGGSAAVSTVVLVEGFFDCIKVHQAGYPCVAMMGSSLSEEQEKLLQSHFSGVLVMLDGDEAGRKGTDDCLLRLGRLMWVKGITLPENKQPDQFSSNEIKTIIGGK